MPRTAITVITAVFLLGMHPRAWPTAPPQDVPGVSAAPNYADSAAWLCLPDRHDACETDLTTTVIAADGSTTRERWAADPHAPIDCFYVYPTVSAQPTPYAAIRVDPEERAVVRGQFARFGSVCRTYAPLYRQVTLLGLRDRMLSGAGVATSRGVPDDDVRAAWRYYLDHYNNGRGVVLIGHSQGSFALMDLLRQDIDGQPAASRLVSAILAGTTLPLRRGQDIGLLAHIPLCHAASQTGCVITFASYRAAPPPPANALFGHVADPTLTAACTNPAALGGGTGALRSYFPTTARAWLASANPIDSPFVSLPGLLTAECQAREDTTYLAITVHATPDGPRANDIPGDTMILGHVAANWGLHLADMPLTIGNLVDIVRDQAKAYVSKIRRSRDFPPLGAVGGATRPSSS